VKKTLITTAWLALVFCLPAIGAPEIRLAGPENARFDEPFAAARDQQGNLFIAEYASHRIRRVDVRGQVTPYAGTGQKGAGGDGGPAANAQFDGIHHIAIGPGGNLYIADTGNNRVRKIDHKTGQVSTVIGTGTKGFSGDGGPAAQAQFGAIYCIAFDTENQRMFLADLDNRRIRAVDMESGLVRTIAGDGRKGIPIDGNAATQSPLVDPRAVAVDEKGNVYIVERSGHALRVVDPQGRIRTVAGTGKAGPSQEDGEALKTPMNGPKHACADPDGNILIADTENHAILKYDPVASRLTRILGSGKPDDLNRPHGVYRAPDGMTYVSDSNNGRILIVKW
jgi:DNA-binding beta-propeller fold protein YncE